MPKGERQPARRTSKLGLGQRVLRAAAAAGEVAIIASQAAPVHADNTAVQSELNTRPTIGSTLEAVGLSHEPSVDLQIPDITATAQGEEPVEVAEIDAAPERKAIPMPDGRTFYTEDGTSGFSVRNADVVVQDGDWPISREWQISPVETVQAFGIAGLVRRYPTDARGGFATAPYKVNDYQQALDAGLIPADALVPENMPRLQGDEGLPSSNTIDVLSLPGWSRFSTLTRLPDGSMQITSPDRASELRVLNRTDFIKIGDGLELFVKMNAVSKADPSSPRTSQIILFDSQLEIFIGVDRNGYLILLTTDANHHEYFAPQQAAGKRLSSDELKIEIVPAGQDKVLNIFDGATGELLVKGFKPQAAFPSNDLNVGFYPQTGGDLNGVILTVTNFEAHPLSKT